MVMILQHTAVVVPSALIVFHMMRTRLVSGTLYAYIVCPSRLAPRNSPDHRLCPAT